MIQNDDAYLPGKILIAMPGMNDPRFTRAVIYMCSHDAGGAMGLMVNHVVPGLNFGSLLKELKIAEGVKLSSDIVRHPVLNGGPVETARGFVLHTKDFKHDDTIEINDSFNLTGTVDALKDIANGDGPEGMIFALGYAGWGAGQLDEELQHNAWLTGDATPDLIFGCKPAEMWDKAVQTIGVDPALLSPVSGRA